MKLIAAIAVFSVFVLRTASAHADQCPAGSGAYCPAGTHCAYGMCVYDNPWKAAHQHHKIHPRAEPPQH